MESHAHSNRLSTGWRRFVPSTVTLWLVAVNVVVMVAVVIIGALSRTLGDGFQPAVAWLDLPGGWGVMSRPWSVLTYMMTQSDPMHCVLNMLWLYWFGTMFCYMRPGRQLLWLYVAGGVGGALAFIIATLLNPGIGFMLEGSSAAISGIVAATACIAPNLRINLLLLGSVKIKWIAVVTIAVFAFGLTGEGFASNLAHLGGAAAGILWWLWQRVKVSRKSRGLSISSDRPVSTLSDAEARAELDQLLDRVRQSGYGSLTADERRKLFELSRRV